MSTGQPSVGREIEIDPALLARLGAVPKLLGHIHRHQQIHDAWYLGSIAKNDFGENEEKVFGVLDFESPTDWSIDFEPITVAAQHLVEGRLSPEGFAISTVDGTPTNAGDFPRSWAGADVKCRYHYKRSEHSALDRAHIYAEFAGCRSLKLDPIAALEREVRAPEVAKAVTIEAKASAYCERKGITWTPAIAGKLTALQQQTSEAILAEVAALAAAAGTTPAPSADRQVA